MGTCLSILGYCRSRCYEKIHTLQLQLGPASGGLISSQLHAGLFEHEPRRHAGIAVVVLVAVVHHLGNARLDDGLGALVAGEQRHVSDYCGRC